MTQPEPDTPNLPLADLHVEFGERPLMPALPDATDHHRASGRRLAAIHRMHLMDMHRIAGLLERIDAGDAPRAALSAEVAGLELTENMRAFGTLCGRECRVLTFHHDAEEHSLFPMLEAQDISALTAVVARLRDEHKVVHELLHRLEAAANALVNDGSEAAFTQARQTFDQLFTVVKSHFGYEETQLEEALGMFVREL